MRTGWRAGFKNQTEIDNYKTELLKACSIHKINTESLLERGLFEASRETGKASEFLPSVNKFISWCKPQEHWEHARIRISGENRPDRLLTDMGSKARAIAARDKTMKQYRGE